MQMGTRLLKTLSIWQKIASLAENEDYLHKDSNAMCLDSLDAHSAPAYNYKVD
jgi:hypothetical protein